MKTWAPSSTNRFAVANPIPSVPPVMTAVLPSSFLVTVFLRRSRAGNSPARMLYARSLLECEHRLAKVVGQMVRAVQQDREAIPRRILREIFFRNGRVPQDPFAPRHLFKPLPQFGIDYVPCLAHLFVRRNVGPRPVGIRDEGDVKLRMKPFSQAQQRQHGVVDGRQMSPQVKHSIPARCYFPKNLLGREASKKLVRPIDLGLPCFQPESYARRVVCHASISCRHYVVQRTEGVRRWQWLSVEYVDRRAGDALVLQDADQRLLIDDRPARCIDQSSRRLHSVQLRGPYQAARTVAQHQMDRQDVGALEQLVFGHQV